MHHTKQVKQMAKRLNTISGEYMLHDSDETLANISVEWEAECDHEDGTFYVDLGDIYADTGIDEIGSIKITEAVQANEKLYKKLRVLVENHIADNFDSLTDGEDDSDFSGGSGGNDR